MIIKKGARKIVIRVNNHCKSKTESLRPPLNFYRSLIVRKCFGRSELYVCIYNQSNTSFRFFFSFQNLYYKI